MSRQIEELILKVSVDDRGASAKINKYSSSATKADSSVGGLSKSFKVLGGVIAALGLKQLAEESLDVAIQFDKVNNSLKSVLGNQQLVNKEMAGLSDLSNKLGLNLLTTAEAYSKVAAASKGTALEGEGARTILKGVSEASTALGLSAGETSGALLAINQIISKGKVQAEELRGQLGERIPGAFQIAARAMGKTTQELDKMLESGQLLSEDFIPKFADQLRNEFGPAAIQAAGSAQASMNRLKNEWENALVGMGSSLTRIIPALERLLRNVNAIGSSVIETKDAISDFTTALFFSIDTIESSRNAEAALLIEQGKRNRMIKAQTESINKQKQAIAQLEGSLKKLNALNQIGVDIGNQESLKSITDQLSLTTSEYEKLSPAILDAIQKGASHADIIEKTTAFVKAYKEELNAVEEVTVKIDNPFDELLKGATQFKQAMDLGKQLGLTEKQFEKVSGALKKAVDKGIDPAVIKARLRGLADVGFFDESKDKKKKKGSDKISVDPVTSQFELGTASASEFLQSTKLSEERNKLLNDIKNNTAKNKDNGSQVSFVAKG